MLCSDMDIALDPPSQLCSPTLCGADEARADMRRQLDLLFALADTGLDLARGLARLAADAPAAAPAAPDGEPPAPPAAAPSPEPPPRSAGPGEIAMAYARVSRAVRLAVILQSRVIKDLKAMAELDAREADEKAELALRQTPTYRRKQRIEAIIERVATAQYADNEAAVDTLVCEAGDRLDDTDRFGDLLQRPMSELIDRICRDLGLDPDWPALAQEGWARWELAGDAPGAPLLAVAADVPRPPPPPRPARPPAPPGERRQLAEALAVLKAWDDGAPDEHPPPFADPGATGGLQFP